MMCYYKKHQNRTFSLIAYEVKKILIIKFKEIINSVKLFDKSNIYLLNPIKLYFLFLVNILVYIRGLRPKPYHSHLFALFKKITSI